MDRDAVVAHDLGLQIMVVDLQRDELPREGILAGLDEEVALGVLDAQRLSGQSGEILFELRAQRLVPLVLRGERERGEKGRQGQQKAFHNTTPSGMKAE